MSGAPSLVRWRRLWDAFRRLYGLPFWLVSSDSILGICNSLRFIKIASQTPIIKLLI
jgi:hypothetical protein